ncbi:MAG: protease-4 [Phenylobacterium sp.]|jgi:protease-4
MSNETKPGIVKRFFQAIWDTINFSRRFFVNVFFVIILVLFIDLIFSDDKAVKIAAQSALVLDLSGNVVEQKKYQDPTSEFINSMQDAKKAPEVLLSDALLVINHATTNDKIKLMVLDLHGMNTAGLNKLKAIGSALEDFKATGKKIIAVGDYYSQNQYYLASYADEIIMNPMGGIIIDGYSYYSLYFKDALAKLKVTQHVFKVGKFKSAVEPYIREDMSPEAKEANIAWLNELWSVYKQDITQRRNMPVGNFDENLDDVLSKLKSVDGDFAQYALNNHWVDALKSRQEMRQYLIEHVGEDADHSFERVYFDEYLSLVKPPFAFDNPMLDKVAVIIAKGTIVDGHRKAGSIGGDSTAKLLRTARLDDSVKAVVLRVDSPGGSAFASEIIRKEVDALKADGKPVIASMGSVAASGGYWISASANEIWASPTTITGSIGIFGMFMTFENSLKTLGVSSDGVATTEMAGASLLRPLNPKLGDVIQLNVEKGYRRFINLVAENRNMSPEDVDKVAQGRVWTGAMALKLGLVDKLGTLDDAIQAAADLASLTSYDIKLVEQELSSKDKLLKQLFHDSDASADTTSSAQTFGVHNVMQMFNQQLSVLNQFNDPQHMYVHCAVCEID